MQPLLSITSVPISVEYNVKRASLQHKQPRAELNISRSRGKSDIRTDLARVKIDSTEARSSMGLKTPRRLTQEFSEAGKKAARDAARAYVQDGNHILDSHGKGQPILDNAARRYNSQYEYQMVLTYIPSVRPEITAEGGTISFDYTMDRLTFDWNVHHKPEFDFIPGEIDITVTQYPQVVIEYLGGPIYAPPSADPNYEPPAALDSTV